LSAALPQLPPGLRIALTRSPEDAASWESALRERGARAVAWPCVEVRPLDVAAEELCAALADADWVALSSPRSLHLLREGLDGLDALDGAAHSWACVGPATAHALHENLGIEADLVATGGSAASLAAELAAACPSGARVLALGPREGRRELAEHFARLEHPFSELALYETTPLSTPPPVEPDALDGILFASPSAVRGWSAAVADEPGWLRGAPPTVALGPSTRAALEEAGVEHVPTATTRDLAGLLRALLETMNTRPSGGATARQP